MKLKNGLVLILLLGPALVAQVRWPLPPAEPPHITAEATLIPQGEPGEPLVVRATVFAPDGTARVPGVTVFAYNTDAEGYYRKDGRIWPPRLHGWARTDAHGGFTLRTIRPGPYPGRSIPAHVHFQLWGGGYPFQYAGALRFADDPLLTTDDRRRAASEGKFGLVCSPQKNAQGVWNCTMALRASTVSNYHGDQTPPR